MKIRNCLWYCLMAGFSSCSTSGKENLNLTISKETLFDKVRGAWAGQIIGCAYGGPTEFQYLSAMIPDSVKIPWGTGEIKKWFDGGGGLFDDVYVDLTFVETFERCGLDAPIDSFAAAFLAKEYPLCHANQQARYNLLQGLSPHASGFWKNNPHANCLDFQIEADFAGIMAPGMANSAVNICDRIGHIMSYGDGWYGGVYVATMYSLAYVSDDIEYIVTEGLKTIPRESRFYTCMMDVINWYKQYPDNWKKCWEEIEKKWGGNDIACPDGVGMPFNIETYVNGAYIILGLLYGQGDFEKTIDISTRAGQDSDCNPASSGGIVGTMLGYSRIPEKYKRELVVVEDIPFNNTVSFNKGCELSFGHALQMIRKGNGRISEDEIEISFQNPVPARLEISFEGLRLKDKITVDNWIANFPAIEFEGSGAVIKGELKGKDVPENYIAELEVYFNDKLIDICKLPLKHNRRKHELFFNYEQSYGKYKLTCKWTNPVQGADIWVRDVMTYIVEK